MTASLHARYAPSAVGLILATTAALALGACSDRHEWAQAGVRTTDADRLHPIGAEVRRETLDLPPAGGPATAQSENYFAVTRFVRQYIRDGRGQFEVRVAAKGGDKTASFVRNILQQNGVDPVRVRFGKRGDGGSGALLSYTRIAAVAPLSCDDWSEDITRRVEQGAYANWGCASQRNLANMVADPTDLVTPSVADAPTADRALANYRAYTGAKSAAGGGGGGGGSASAASSTAAAPGK